MYIETRKKQKHDYLFNKTGISTSAGIADFRSGINTVLDTGAGKWAAQAAKKQGIKTSSIKRNKKQISTFQAYPTAAHMSLVQLMQSGYLKYLISQNTDGLHRRSGIAIDKLSELHGNSTLEICEKCNKEYMRDYRCRGSLRKPKSGKDHYTGRYCNINECDGKLKDTIVNFGEHVRFDPFALARGNTDQSDLFISLGSSLTVAPANAMPKDIGQKWKEEIKGLKNNQYVTETQYNLVVVNLQKTPLHEMGIVSLPIFAKIDDVMKGLMKELQLKIPKWWLRRYIKIRVQRVDNKKQRMMIVSGCDSDGTLFGVFKSIKMRYNGKNIDNVMDETKGKDEEKKNSKKGKEQAVDECIFYVPKWKKNTNNKNKKGIFAKLKKNKQMKDDEKKEEEEEEEKEVDYIVENEKKGLIVEVEFYGNYKEPKLMIKLNEYLNNLLDNDGEIVLRLTMDPVTYKWKIPQFWDVNDVSYGVGLQEIVLIKLYKTSYGFDGVNAVLFANNKSLKMLPSPQQITMYLEKINKYKVVWIGGKTGKEDMMGYTAFYHHFGMLYCYFYDYYVPKIKLKFLKNILNELYGINNINDQILNSICEYEGICGLMNDFLNGDWMNPYPFYTNLIIKRMWSNIDKFSNEWNKFLNIYSKHRQ